MNLWILLLSNRAGAYLQPQPRDETIPSSFVLYHLRRQETSLEVTGAIPIDH